MTRVYRILLLTLGMLLALVPAAAFAADGDDEGDLILRINGPITVAAGDTYDNVVVISDNATVDGTITGSLFVIDGDAVVTGQVADDITVIRGTLTLESTARVNNVSVIRGELVRDAGATVTGEVTRASFSFDWWTFGILSVLVWIGVTLAVVLGGLIFAAVASRQLKAAGDYIQTDIGPALLAVLLAWIAVPMVMIAAIVTIVGAPIGLGYFVFVLPALWFLGYIVAGSMLGRTILHRTVESDRPYLATLLGLLLLQVVGLVPWFGGLVSFVAGVLGSGALLLLAWRAWRGPRVAQPAPTTATARAQAPA